MKVIDLFNDMNNKKPLPNKIKVQCINEITEDSCIYTFSPCLETYVNDENRLLENATNFATLLDLKVEIPEEQKDNKIKELKSLNNVGNSCDLEEFKDKQQLNNHLLKDKLNEVIKEVNKLKEDK